jgi:formate dehydrogenase subunit gamma
MPILHQLQDVFGHIDPRAVDLVADALNLSKAEVYGVVTFYKDFRSEPPGTSVIQVCRGEACQSMGAERLARHAREHLASKCSVSATARSPRRCWSTAG